MSEPGTSTSGDQAAGEREEPDPEQATEHEAGEPGEQPSWWHTSHPTFAGLVGFFSGVAFVIVVPGIYAGLLGLLLSDSTAQRLYPLVALVLVVPLGMLAPRKTRRFAQFMLLGVVATALVIGLTTALVLFVLVKTNG